MYKIAIIRKIDSGKYRLYSRKKDKGGKRRNLGTFDSLSDAKKHEREVEYFKKKDDASDGMADDKATKSLDKMSDIATYLEEAGFVDAADKVYKAMANIDGSFEDDLIDNSMLLPDAQRNLEGGGGIIPGSAGGGAPGLLAIDEAEKVASQLVNMANRLDKLGYYDEANDIDEILRGLTEEALTDQELDRMSMDYEDERREKLYRNREKVMDPEKIEELLGDKKLRQKDIEDPADPDSWDIWDAKSPEDLERHTTYVPGYDSPTGKPTGSLQVDPGEAWYQGLEGEDIGYDAIDDGEVIKELEEMAARKKKQRVEAPASKRQEEEALVRSNGLAGTGVTENGMFQGFSDAYFYSGYGNQEH